MRNPAHPADCNCADCWEPRPEPGQTMDEVCAIEFRKELAQMPDKYVGMILEMAAAEQQRRHPSSIVVDSTMTADREEVSKLVKLLCDAMDQRLSQEPPVGFLNSFMAVANFARFVIETIERETKMELEQKRAFRSMFVATVHKSLMSRLMN